MQTAYIVAGLRTAVCKSKRGGLRFYRPDDLAVDVIRGLLAGIPQLDPRLVDDVIVGNAVPEAEQGLQVGRIIANKAVGEWAPGLTVNRYCGSGLEAIAIATAKIQAGQAECIIAGGTESMSLVPTAGWRTMPNYAIKEGYFKEAILPVKVREVYVNEKNKRAEREVVVDTDEGPRADTSAEALAKLPPVFAQGGTVTAGNSSQTSDGAAFTIVMSERLANQLNVTPIGRLVACASAGVDPRLMGIGPIKAVPKALQIAGMTLGGIDLVELNEAFASQSIAVIRELDMNPDIVNINGGAISLGHPLGCTGAKLTIQLLSDLKRLNKKYGIVTACIGGGQGIAGVIERV
jgi:acetyl-CoA acyltransferase